MLLALYIPAKLVARKRVLLKLHELWSRHSLSQHAVVALGDINAPLDPFTFKWLKSPRWDTFAKMAQLLPTRNFALSNSRQITWLRKCYTATSYSNIDFVMSNPRTSRYVKSTKVLSNRRGSDHWPLQSHVTLRTAHTHKVRSVNLTRLKRKLPLLTMNLAEDKTVAPPDDCADDCSIASVLGSEDSSPTPARSCTPEDLDAHTPAGPLY